jgi:hypothetical protein
VGKHHSPNNLGGTLNPKIFGGENIKWAKSADWSL